MAHKGAAHRPVYTTRSGGSGRRAADKVHNIFVQAAKNRYSMEEVCPCCNPGYDGAINKPKFLASGDQYRAPKSMTDFFSRGRGGGFKAGKSHRNTYRAGAVHSQDGRATRSAVYVGDAHGGESRGERAARAGFRPAGKAPGLFSKPGGLGPSERPAVAVNPRAGGAFKAGKYKPVPQQEYRAPSPITVAPKRKPVNNRRPFKAASMPADFFKKEYLMSEPAHPIRGRRGPAGKWYPGGKGGRPFAPKPEHLPDPYNGSHVRFMKEGMYYGKDGCMERAVKGPQMYVCLCWSRATPPVEWGKEKVHDMYEHRVAQKGNFVYSVMPVNQVPQSMSGRVGKVIAVK